MISRAQGFAKEAGLITKVTKALTGPWREKKIIKALGFRMRRADPTQEDAILDGVHFVKNPTSYQTARGARIGKTLSVGKQPQPA